MSDGAKIKSLEFCRRSMLQNLAFTAAGGVAVLCTTVIGVRSAVGQTKASQKAVGYQDMPKGAQQCDNCTQFVAPAACKVVEGNIAPTGWCKMYVKKPA
jgi:hypothetical protein